MEIVSAEHGPLLLHITPPSRRGQRETLVILASFKEVDACALLKLFVELLQQK